MKIDGVKNNVVNFYKKSEAKTQPKTTAVKKDTIELSTAGKSLSALSLDGKIHNSKEKIEAIKNEVNKGTYKMDSALTAKKMMDIMKGRDI
ncbi:flagellar biosynthesis anti-sigma factor FlgM [Clostridium sp.]|uniref:flagellar biosynthesis anti-sigma factor FlgM n=1 Tax=Clostridium sp. TaxID=1506 RepID=UPI001A3BE44B|nr:flagellar biosynthesis anti-sigma factor FlgM [Clostridium sp.]MBK5240379.1 flagellar biosynthesis anti-sigma factor FlgM [Clostridium sp.]